MIEKKIIVIGAGPAGISVALQLKRYGIDFVVFEKNRIGGLIKNANLIENYPGFPEGINGVEFVKLLKEQLEINNIIVKILEVNEVDFINNKFSVKTTDNELYLSDYLVIATGTKPKVPFQIEMNDLNGFVFFDLENLKNMKNKEVLILGAGDIAFDYALTLSELNKVIILNRSNKIKAIPPLINLVNKNKNIKYFEKTLLKNIVRKNNKLIVEIKTVEKIENLIIDVLLIAIGREVQMDFLNERLLRDKDDLIIKKRLFMCGDVKNPDFKQVSIASGDGTRVAMELSNIIRGEK